MFPGLKARTHYDHRGMTEQKPQCLSRLLFVFCLSALPGCASLTYESLHPYVTLTRGAPLEPHPALVKEGLQGLFALQLRSLLSKYAVWSKLNRTASAVPTGGGSDDGRPQTVWDFLMAETDSKGTLSQVELPNILHGIGDEGAWFETVGNSAPIGEGFAPLKNANTGGPHTTSDLAPEVENILALFKHELGQVESIELYRSALRIQQPSIHVPGTTDCVSCHSSTSARETLAKTISIEARNRIDNEILGLWADSRFDLRNLSPRISDTRVVRALGYTVSEPAISWRVIYESAIAAEKMSQ